MSSGKEESLWQGGRVCGVGCGRGLRESVAWVAAGGKESAAGGRESVTGGRESATIFGASNGL